MESKIRLRPNLNQKARKCHSLLGFFSSDLFTLGEVSSLQAFWPFADIHLSFKQSPKATMNGEWKGIGEPHGHTTPKSLHAVLPRLLCMPLAFFPVECH
jgi:hypothetical protein